MGQLVRAYPGAREAEDLTWLDVWFRERVIAHHENSLQANDSLRHLDQAVIHPSRSTGGRVAKLKSVRPHYFRGFRTASVPISLDDDFVVIDGPNSSGKTSLAEAIEWLFSGSLSRRDVKDLGNPRELENCIGNQFRPIEEQTWVEVVLAVGEADSVETRTLKRVLTQDYGTTSTSQCESLLFLDGKELSTEEERNEMDELFAGVPPLLMQHTLRLFVESTPARRREYFERLLRMDELTDLISRAVIGEARFNSLVNANGGTGLNAWNELGSILPPGPQQLAHRQTSRSETTDANVVRETLASVARGEFSEATSSVDASEINGNYIRLLTTRGLSVAVSVEASAAGC